MKYSEYKQTDAYKKAKSGSQIDVLIFLESDPSYTPIGRGNGLSWAENFDQYPVEEWGNDGIDEYADGLMSGSGNISSIFIPEQNDKMPTRETFKGQIYNVMQVTSRKHPNPGVVLNVLTGVKFNSRNVNQGGRGLVGDNVGFVYSEQIPGERWAEMTGNA